MNTKNLITGIVAGIIVFAIGMISWMALPFHIDTMNKLNAEPIAVAALKQAAPDSGIYYYPSMDASKEAQMKAPHILVTVNNKEKSMPVCMAIGLLINILAGLILTCLISKANKDNFKDRMMLVFKAALLIFLAGHLPNWQYWGFTTTHTLLTFIDVLVGWGLAGVWISKRV